MTRAAEYGLKLAEYADKANDNLLVICQVESVKTVDNIEAIGAVDGIDVLFIGPFDLSASMGKPGQFDDPAVADALDRAEAGIQASGKTLGGILRPGDSLAGMVERGYGLMISASDATLLRDAALADLKTARG